MDQTFDSLYWSQGNNICGLDEVGVTAIAGPLVAACVVLPRLSSSDDLSLFVLEDSKKVKEKDRYSMARIVQRYAIAYGFGMVLPCEVDAINTYNASNLAMRRAIDNCRRQFGKHAVDYCLIDGNRPIKLDIPHKLIIKGDSKSLSVAAASVLAKVHRDLYMKNVHKSMPEYGFYHNKGYKCEDHFKGLDQSGIKIGLHRVSMFPFVKKRGEDPSWHSRRINWWKITEDSLL